MTIAVWGVLDDSPLAAVHRELTARKADVAFLDQRRTGDIHLDLDFRSDGTPAGELRVGPRRVDVADVRALYLRPYPADSPAARALEQAMGLWSDLHPGLAVNPLGAMAGNDSKPCQLQLIAAAGFDVPDTIVTTDPEAVREFRARHHDVIYKSVSGRRSRVSRLRPSHDDRIDDVRWCPTQFQQYIPGSDYRVHVVGGAVHTTEIRGPADDYRFASGSDVVFRAVDRDELDDGLATRLIDLSRSLGLAVAGIDLRRTPEGRWYCLEVNPSPAFTYYEQATGQPIAAAVADLLTGADAPGRG